MKIKDYTCKCGHSDFFFADKGNQKGIYCSYCGKWLKWADKDEQNLVVKPEPKTEWHIAHGMFECSCGYIHRMDSNMMEWNYCPLCGGTRMVSE